MYIEKRKKKAYSAKLFNELCILYLIIDSGEFENYVLDKKIKRSGKTYNRYLKDIFSTGLLPIDAIKLNSIKDIKSRCYEFNKQKYGYYYPNSIELIEKYSIKNHINNRLYRTCLLLINVYRSLDYNNSNVEFDDFDIPNDYIVLSKRTFQRDIKLVKDVIVYMFEE